jgi:hypothetical protein
MLLWKTGCPMISRAAGERYRGVSLLGTGPFLTPHDTPPSIRVNCYGEACACKFWNRFPLPNAKEIQCG